MIVGLGNPGPKYALTRHNVGYRITDKVGEKFHSKVSIKTDQFVAEKTIFENEELVLVKPITYMNLSGQAVKKAQELWHFELTDLLVVLDDLNLPFGKLRARPNGGSGGQNGMDSIIAELETNEIQRLRVGIGKPETSAEWADYVLQPFNADEEKDLASIIDLAAEASLFWVTNGMISLMNKYNNF